MILGMIELIRSFKGTFETEAQGNIATKALRPAILDKFTEYKCSEEFRDLYLPLIMNFGLSVKPITTETQMRLLVTPLLESKIEYSTEDFVALVEDLNHDVISEVIEGLDNELQDDILAAIIINQASEISQEKLNFLISLSDIPAIMNGIEDIGSVNPFLKNIEQNRNLDRATKDNVIDATIAWYKALQAQSIVADEASQIPTTIAGFSPIAEDEDEDALAAEMVMPSITDYTINRPASRLKATWLETKMHKIDVMPTIDEEDENYYSNDATPIIGDSTSSTSVSPVEIE